MHIVRVMKKIENAMESTNTKNKIRVFKTVSLTDDLVPAALWVIYETDEDGVPMDKEMAYLFGVPGRRSLAVNLETVGFAYTELTMHAIEEHTAGRDGSIFFRLAKTIRDLCLELDESEWGDWRCECHCMTSAALLQKSLEHEQSEHERSVGIWEEERADLFETIESSDSRVRAVEEDAKIDRENFRKQIADLKKEIAKHKRENRKPRKGEKK